MFQKQLSDAQTFELVRILLNVVLFVTFFFPLFRKEVAFVFSQLGLGLWDVRAGEN